MADTKTSDLDNIPAVDRAADFLYIADTSGGTPNKVTPNTLLGISGDPVGTSDTQTLTAKTLTQPIITADDDEFTLQDNADTTKKLQFQLSGISASTTRTLTVPDVSDTIVTLGATQTLTNKTLTSPTINTATISNPTLTVDTISEHTSANGVSIDGVTLKDSNGTFDTVTTDDLVLGDTTTMTAGTGITTGSGTVYSSRVYQLGNVVKTEIFIDLTGLNSSTAGDIIGVNATANCHLGQVTTSVNGVVYSGQISCIEAPATGEPDIDVYSANESTGTEDNAVTGLTETALQQAGADYTTIGPPKAFTATPPADDYLYLVGSGGGTSATYTAGQFLIELWGYKSA